MEDNCPGRKLKTRSNENKKSNKKKTWNWLKTRKENDHVTSGMRTFKDEWKKINHLIRLLKKKTKILD